MVVNGWTEKVEELERENAELKATEKLLTDELIKLGRLVGKIKKVL